MIKKTDYFGQLRMSKVYDGSIRKVEDNKTVGLHIDKKNALILAKICLDYGTPDYSGNLIITTYKKNINKDGARATATVKNIKQMGVLV